MTKKIIIASAIAFATFTPFAFAESHPINDSTNPPTRKEKFVQRMEDKKFVTTEHKENGEELKSLQQDKLKALHEEFNAKHDEFKKKILDLKDQHKKIIVDRVDSRLVTINQNWVQRMNASILRLERLLDKFSGRAERLKAEGKNTTEVETAIVAAERAIQTAKDAVAVQGAKEYVADLSNEENLKSTVGDAISELRKDLKIAHDIVKVAKQKVIDVARALAKINKTSDIPSIEPTQTSTPSPTEVPEI
ncbi:MAG TPA: hypothetical protein VM077_03710 [Candidatus Limnocylindrales bacterium]|nr:hypothetical protein [Candidatus Limnocylindrales bacterium]